MNLLLAMIVGLFFKFPIFANKYDKAFDERLMRLNRLEDDPTIIAGLQDFLD